MARRRKPEDEPRQRPTAPLWVTNLSAGLERFGGRFSGGVIDLSGDCLRRLREAREQWCEENGCWRSGSKDCPVVCDGRLRAERSRGDG